jgi:hypothetical protein
MGSIRGKNCLLQFLPREFSAGKLAKFFLQTNDAPSVALLVYGEKKPLCHFLHPGFLTKTCKFFCKHLTRPAGSFAA